MFDAYLIHWLRIQKKTLVHVISIITSFNTNYKVKIGFMYVIKAMCQTNYSLWTHSFEKASN